MDHNALRVETFAILNCPLISENGNIDLNPVAAGIIEVPEASPRTSIHSGTSLARTASFDYNLVEKVLIRSPGQ